MSAYFLIDPEFQSFRARAAQARADEISRIAYLAIDGIDRSVRSAAGAAIFAAKAVSGRFRLWRERRAAVRALLRLDDRMLRDVGLSRAEIEDAVYGRPAINAPAAATQAPSPTFVAVAARADEDPAWRKAA